jgi:hypothetical protein
VTQHKGRRAKRYRERSGEHGTGNAASEERDVRRSLGLEAGRIRLRRTDRRPGLGGEDADGFGERAGHCLTRDNFPAAFWRKDW